MSIVKLDVENSTSTEFDETIVQNIGGNRSLCYIFPTRLNGRFAGSGAVGLITLDYKSNEIVLFNELNDRITYQEVEVVPLQTDTNETMQIVDVISFGLPSRVPRSLGVLLTSGQDGGEHRLVHITQERDGLETNEIIQKTYAWTGGIPVSLVAGNFGGDDENAYRTDDLVVITNSNQSLFFEGNSVRAPIGDSTANRDYAEPVFFETFPGAGSAVTVNQRSSAIGEIDIDDVLVSYPETGELRFYNPDPTLPKVQPPN